MSLIKTKRFKTYELAFPWQDWLLFLIVFETKITKNFHYLSFSLWFMLWSWTEQTLDLLPCLFWSLSGTKKLSLQTLHQKEINFFKSLLYFECSVKKNDVSCYEKRENNIKRKWFASKSSHCALRWCVESEIGLRHNKHLSTHIRCVLWENLISKQNRTHTITMWMFK